MLFFQAFPYILSLNKLQKNKLAILQTYLYCIILENNFNEIFSSRLLDWICYCEEILRTKQVRYFENWVRAHFLAGCLAQNSISCTRALLHFTIYKCSGAPELSSTPLGPLQPGSYSYIHYSPHLK